MRVRAIISPWMREGSRDSFWEDYRNSCLETTGRFTQGGNGVRESRPIGHLEHPDREAPRAIWKSFADMDECDWEDEYDWMEEYEREEQR